MSDVQSPPGYLRMKIRVFSLTSDGKHKKEMEIRNL